MKLFRCMSAFLVTVALTGFAHADDWTGKSVKVKQDGLKLGRKLGGGLVRDGAALNSAKSYTVKSDDGSLLELTGQTGFVFKSDVELSVSKAAEPKADDKPLALGTKLLPKKPMAEIAFWELDKDGNKEMLKLQGSMPVEVRKDAGNGTVRIHDWHREGWVNKADFVTIEDAPIYWDRAVKANPTDTFALEMRGESWLRKGEPDNAIKDFNECIRLDPSNSGGYSDRGRAWHVKKEYDKAIADYTEAIRLNQKSVYAFHNRGRAWRSKGEIEKAIADYTEAIRLDPNETFSLNNLAWIYATCYDAKNRDGNQAIEFAKKSLAIKGDSKRRDTLAAAYAEAGDFELAVAEQRKALDDKSLDKDDREKMEKRLELFRAKKPYRDEE